MRRRGGLGAGVALLAAAVVLYVVAAHSTATSVVFALLLFAGFGLLARALLRRDR